MTDEYAEIRREVVRLLSVYSRTSPESYLAFMTAAHAYFHLKESVSNGRVPLNERFARLSSVHNAVESLQADDEDNDILDHVHHLIHDLHALLYAEAEEHDIELGELDEAPFDKATEEEDDLLQAHAEDFRLWAEQPIENTEE